jgi:predicted dinucleotide-binding enzyme
VTTVGFIGSGRIGGTVARLAIAAGYNVVLSNSRVPQNLKDLVEELGRARAATPADAAAAGDLVVVSIPPRAYPVVPEKPLAGKPVLDTINYILQRDGRIPGLGGSLSSCEALQRHLAMAHVIKVLTNITSWHPASLARPAGAANRRRPADHGEDSAAKAALTGFLDAIGYDTVDSGTLRAGRPPFPVWYPRVRHAVRHVQRPAAYPGRQGGNTRRPRRLTATGDQEIRYPC